MKRDIFENFEAQFKKSTLTLVVLALLSEESMYAYDIERQALRMSKQKYKMPLLYNTLNKLAEMGMVMEGEKVISEDNRLRIYYVITEKGLQHLEKLKSMYVELNCCIWPMVYGKNLDT